ncbi:MAG: insulinase family protein [Candidatus Dadabacteria bacterium]|nr:MAG: insulinase family protein [Candidatus Dadabacteria bacterium]
MFMWKKRIWLLTILLLLPFIAVHSLSATTEESREALKSLSAKVKKVTLSNGLRVIMYRRGSAPVFTGALAVRVGGVNEKPGQTGISHLFEHMAFKGTDKIGTRDFGREKKLLARLEEIKGKEARKEPLTERDREELAQLYKELEQLWEINKFMEAFEEHGANGMNATTDKELTQYFVNMPRSAFEFWCWMESERILHPVMRQFYRERDVVLEERRLRYEDDPGGKLYETLLAVAYLRHPYRNPVIGYKSDIESLTASMLYDFHRRYYVPSNMVLSVVGDIDYDRDLQMLEKYFGRIPAGASPSLHIAPEEEQRGERVVEVEFPAAPQLLIAYHKPQYPHPDDPAISIMEEMLAGSRVSPLYKELVQKERIAAEVDYFEAPGRLYPNLVVFSSSVKKPFSVDRFIEKFDRVINDFKKTPVNNDLLLIAKRSVAMNYLSRLSSNDKLALDFASSEVTYGDWRVLIDWFDKAMAVKAEDVSRVARTYLRRGNRTIVKLKTVAAKR